jgi:hypothetical protein
VSTVQTFQMTGWYEINGEGIATIYLSAVDEGIVTGTSDTPANTQFRPRVLNADTFSIKRMPPVWPQAQTTVQGAAYGSLDIDNYDGAFDFLISADLRDATVVFKLPAAGSLLTGTTMNSAPLIATAILDAVTCDSEDVITLSFKDTIARLDRPLPCRYNPPFVDSAASNQMVPISLGAFRNVAPLLIDSPNRIYEISDRPISNLSLVSDKGAPLDPTASPPQYTPALSNSGLQLAVLPQGQLTCEGSSVGQQASLPGIADVLAGAGAFPGTQGSGGWFGGINGYATTVAAGGVTGAGATRVVALAANAPASGLLYITDGTNTLYGTITAGGGTTSVTLGTLTIVGTANSITVGSPVVIPGAPTGFTWTQSTAPTEILNPPNLWIPSGNGVFLQSGTTAFNPGTTYGSVFATATAILQPGQSYRVSFVLNNVQSAQPYYSGGMQGGVMLATNLSASNTDYITGINQALQTSAFQSQNFTFEFTVPQGSARKLYFILAPSAGVNAVTAAGKTSANIANIKVQLLGQFTSLPLSALPLTDYFTEILVNRAGEASTVFSSTDTAALMVRDVATSDGVAGSNIPFGCCFTSPPNILDALRMPLDSCGAVLFTDNAGVLRARRLTDPSNPVGRTIKADFTSVNVLRPLSVAEDPAQYLTTLFGARRNWSTFSASGFVTDQSIVSQDKKARFMRTSQYWVKSSKTPAGSYNFAIAAPIFDTVFDIANDCQLEADRIVGIWSPNIYTDGTFNTGKRRIVTFTAFYDDPTAVGVTTTTAVTNLQFNDVISLTYPAHGFNATPCAILGWEIFPFAQKIALTVLA